MEIKLTKNQERELLLNQLKQQSVDRLVKHYEELLKEIEEENDDKE